MDSLENELKELKGFIADLKADRQAQKEKEKRESWTKFTSMSLVFIAVLAAVATQYGGKYSSRTMVALNNSTFHQAVASDDWNYFQADSIKRNLYEAAQSLSQTNNNPNAAKLVETFSGKIKKYTSSQDEAQTKAQNEEKQRDTALAAAADSSAHGGAMGLATSIFQISIAMGSICLVAKKRWLWYVSLLLALVGAVKMIIVLATY